MHIQQIQEDRGVITIFGSIDGSYKKKIETLMMQNSARQDKFEDLYYHQFLQFMLTHANNYIREYSF